MGLVRNLRERLGNLGDKILVELSCLYIKQLVKQTTKRQDNSSLTMSSQNHLTTEPPSSIIATSLADTSEKTTMMETEDIVAHVRLWAIDTIDSKGKIEEIYDQLAIIDEFHEWLDINDDKLEILSLDEISEEEYDNFVDGVERS
jgi:hypothetical protein